MATVTRVLVMLLKMGCMLFLSVKTGLCSLSKNGTHSFSSLSASFFLWRPLIFCMLCLVRLSLIIFLNGTTNYAIYLGY